MLYIWLSTFSKAMNDVYNIFIKYHSFLKKKHRIE